MKIHVSRNKLIGSWGILVQPSVIVKFHMGTTRKTRCQGRRKQWTIQPAREKSFWKEDSRKLNIHWDRLNPEKLMLNIPSNLNKVSLCLCSIPFPVYRKGPMNPNDKMWPASGIIVYWSLNWLVVCFSFPRSKIGHCHYWLLVEGKICSKPLDLWVKTTVSGIFCLKPIHESLESIIQVPGIWHRTFVYIKQTNSRSLSLAEALQSDACPNTPLFPQAMRRVVIISSWNVEVQLNSSSKGAEQIAKLKVTNQFPTSANRRINFCRQMLVHLAGKLSSDVL